MDTKTAIVRLRLVEQGRCEEIEDFLLKYGLCHNILERIEDISKRYVDQVLKDWPDGSGNKYYPVKNEKLRNEKRYSTYDYYAFDVHNLYDRRTRYGRDRCKLAGYLADEMEKLNDNDVR